MWGCFNLMFIKKKNAAYKRKTDFTYKPSTAGKLRVDSEQPASFPSDTQTTSISDSVRQALYRDYCSLFFFFKGKAKLIFWTLFPCKNLKSSLSCLVPPLNRFCENPWPRASMWSSSTPHPSAWSPSLAPAALAPAPEELTQTLEAALRANQTPATTHQGNLGSLLRLPQSQPLWPSGEYTRGWELSQPPSRSQSLSGSWCLNRAYKEKQK